jgi:ribosome-associated protein
MAERKKNYPAIPTVTNPPDTVANVLRIAIEQKGIDVMGFDVRGLTDVTDYMLVMSGTSQRHVVGIVDKITEGLSQTGTRPNSKNGYDTGDWIVLDYVDFVVHVFNDPIREFYQIEELWPLAAQVSLPEELENAAKRYRTGMR